MASGILNLDKEVGPTSFAVVHRLKRLPGIKKIGHGGTLDPAAAGVLPILVGSTTRLAEFVHEWPKTYRASVVLGAVSDTDDREGKITTGGPVDDVDASRIAGILPRFIGLIRQAPPLYSALKLDGETLYRRARRGESVKPAERTVEVDAIELLDYQQERASAILEVRCRKGTYVRSLARDLGAALGCGAYLGALTRLAVGPLRLEDSIRVEQLLALGDEWESRLLPADLPLASWPAVTLDAAGVAAVRRGQAVDAPAPGPTRYRMLDGEGRLVAWAEADQGRLQPRAVFQQ
jgi:tRNA pseudouridine55 synthase